MILAIQTDPIHLLKPESDSTLLLSAEFERRGYKILQYEPIKIKLDNAVICAPAKEISLVNYMDTGIKVVKQHESFYLNQADICLIRQNPPFDEMYLTNTFLLENICDKTYFINSPESIRNTPEKLSTLKFPKYIPYTFVTQNEDELRDFINRQGKAVLKSIYGFGGNDIILTDSKQMDSAFAFLRRHKQIIAQEYLPKVVEGDKRVLIVCGEVVGFFRRVPKKGSMLSNLVQGANAVECELTDTERQIIQDIASFLQKQQIAIAGIDLIGGKLIEINVTSPTGFIAYNKLYNTQCEKKVINLLISNCS